MINLNALFLKKKKNILIISILVICIVATTFMIVGADQLDSDDNLSATNAFGAADSNESQSVTNISGATDSDESKSLPYQSRTESNNEDDVSTAVSHDCIIPDDDSFIDIYTPRKGATQKEADQTVLTTDKTSYEYDEEIIFSVESLYEDDYLCYGYNYIVQYYNSDIGEWKNCVKAYSYNDIGILGLGTATESIKISDRLNNIADKYRIILDMSVNDFRVNLISNEFTIQFE